MFKETFAALAWRVAVDEKTIRDIFEDHVAGLERTIRFCTPRVITAMTDWHDEIFNYFEAHMTNAFTESTNSLTRVMNRMGRGYSFDVIRARMLMLYDPEARRRGSVTQAEEEPAAGYMKKTVTWSLSMEYAPKVIEYGAHIPTLEKLAEAGHFD